MITDEDLRARIQSWLMSVHHGADPRSAASGVTSGLSYPEVMLLWVNICYSVVAPIVERVRLSHALDPGGCTHPGTCGVASFGVVAADGSVTPGVDADLPPYGRSAGQFIACCANGDPLTAFAVWRAVPDDQAQPFALCVINSLAHLVPKHRDENDE